MSIDFSIDFTKVISVYSGKAGKCCCGCAGKHTYASATRDLASKQRGYKVEDDEVSDRTVKTIVNKLNIALKDIVQNPTAGDAHFTPTFFSATVGDRLYVAYFGRK